MANTIKLGANDLGFEFGSSQVDSIYLGGTNVWQRVTITPYLTFSSPNIFTLRVYSSAGWDGTMEFSTDTTTWTEWGGREIRSVATNGTYYLYLRGTNNTRVTHGSSSGYFVLTGSNISCEGDIGTLLDYATRQRGQQPTMANYCYEDLFKYNSNLISLPTLSATTLAYGCYYRMFNGCTGITTIPSGYLPATTMANYCYTNMFNGCTGITTIPTDLLPATTLAYGCYKNMFEYCMHLTNLPTLPATTLAYECYRNMFDGCSSITSIPSGYLPATTLAEYCYQQMFYECTSITSIPTNLLPATTLAQYCYKDMFYGCTGLTSVPTLPATTLAQYCYKQMFYGCTGITSVPTNLLPATTLATECYYGMFGYCSNLVNAPKLPATDLTLMTDCYHSMFAYCTSLTILPALKATSLGSQAYCSMFYGCTNVKISASYVYGTYETRYLGGDYTTGQGAFSNMFYATGGTFTGTPAPTSSQGYFTSNVVLDTYNIYPTLVNATASASNPTTIEGGGTATLVYTFDGTTYKCPETAPSITNATGTWTKDSDTQGTLVLSNPVGGVMFTISGEAI